MDVKQAEDAVAHAEQLAAAVAQAEQRVAEAEQGVVLAGRGAKAKGVAAGVVRSRSAVVSAELRVVGAELFAALAERVAARGPRGDSATRKAAQARLNAARAKLGAALAEQRERYGMAKFIGASASAERALAHEAADALGTVQYNLEVALEWLDEAERAPSQGGGGQGWDTKPTPVWVDRYLQPSDMRAKLAVAQAELAVARTVLSTAWQDAHPELQEARTGLEEAPSWREQARTELDKARTGLEEARTGLDKARTGLDKAHTGRDKARTEFDEARTELEEARTELDKARAELDKARTELDKARAELDKAYIALDKAHTGRDKARTEFDEARTELDKARAELATARTAWEAAQVDLPDARAALFAAHGEKLLKQTALIEARAALAASLQPLTASVEACIKALHPAVENRFDFRGLYNAQATITQLRAECERSQATPASLIASLSDMAASLAAASQEVHRSKDAFAPGWALKILQNLGAALGLVAACGVAASAALLALPSAAVISVATVGTLIALAAGTMGSTWAQERLRWYGTTQPSVCRETGLVEDHLQAVRAAAIRCEADFTLETIRVNLSAPAQLFFAPLLALDGSAKTIASGPTYGSTGHAILLGIRAGVISLKSDKGQALLCELLNAQARAAQAPDDRALRKFQQDERLHTVLRALEAHLAYRPGVSELVFLGNVCRGPLSSEQNADTRIREHMAACGVIYLRGRTDAHRGLLYRDETGAATIEPSAEYAFNTLTFAQWQAHDAIFCNEWVSPATRIKFAPPDGAVTAEVATDTLSLDEKYTILRESKSARAALSYRFEGGPKPPWDKTVTNPTYTYVGENATHYTNFKKQLEGKPLQVWIHPEPKLFSRHRPEPELVTVETHQRPTFDASWAELQARADGKTPGRAQPSATVYPKPETSPVPPFQDYA
ncbi:hypothetical protein [Pandoraea sputorum]|uniref:hypothetical protein n=1 Tax=Pandoraea sputorum TaxID=93222 RepID=UPI00178201B9|nr:hypothetical protein [Pandoraea sputorum]